MFVDNTRILTYFIMYGKRNFAFFNSNVTCC